MKTLKPASCSFVAIAIANRSHVRHTSPQARQLDPLREARGRLRGSRPPGGCNACPLKRGAVLGSPGRGWRRSAIPSFFALFRGRGAPHACRMNAKSPTAALLEPPGLVFNIMDVWSGGKPQARSQTPVYPQERFPLRSPGKRPRHRPPIPRAPGGSPRTKTEDE